MPFPWLSIGHFSFWSCVTVSSSANADPAWAPAMSIELKNLFSRELAYPQKSSNAPNCNHEAALHPRRRPRRHVHDSVGRRGARHRHIRGSEHRPRHRRHQREPHHDRLRRQEQRRQVTGSPIPWVHRVSRDAAFEDGICSSGNHCTRNLKEDRRHPWSRQFKELRAVVFA